MGKNKEPIKRIEFLAKNFNIFEDDLEELSENECEVLSKDENVYSIYSWNSRKLKNEGEYIPNNIQVSNMVFKNMVQSDPTEHKEYVQWMLTTFVRLIKEEKFSEAIRFVSEDLELASEYLVIFHKEKNKLIFKNLCIKNKAFVNITDVSNINQYRDLSQLFDAVDPYIERNVSELERNIRFSVKTGDGLIPYEDRKVIILNPLTFKCGKIFNNFTNWCTTGTKRSFDSYTKHVSTPLGRAKLYIIIYKTYLLNDNDLKKSNEIYQLHFETSQFMDKSDTRIKNLKTLLIDNKGLEEYFYNELIKIAKAEKVNNQTNNYISGLNNFGFTNVLFEVLPNNINKIKIIDENLVKVPNISHFNKCDLLYLYNCNIENIDPSIGELISLTNISFGSNKLTHLPNSIGKLINLRVLNLKKNKIKELPNSLKKLDKANGGSLEILSIDEGLVEQARILLPNVNINYGVTNR